MSHLDAAAVAALFLTVWLLRRRAYRRALARVRTILAEVRAQRDDALVALAAIRGEDEALALTADEPIPYQPTADEFERLWHRAFVAEDGGDR